MEMLSAISNDETLKTRSSLWGKKNKGKRRKKRKLKTVNEVNEERIGTKWLEKLFGSFFFSLPWRHCHVVCRLSPSESRICILLNTLNWDERWSAWNFPLLFGSFRMLQRLLTTLNTENWKLWCFQKAAQSLGDRLLLLITASVRSEFKFLIRWQSTSVEFLFNECETAETRPAVNRYDRVRFSEFPWGNFSWLQTFFIHWVFQ